MSRYITVNQVAEYLEVSKQAVNKWIKEGYLKVYRLPSGRIKILRSDFLAYLKENKLFIDKRFFGINRKRIVLLDDNEGIARFLRIFLQRFQSNWKI